MKHDENSPHHLIIDIALPYLDKLKTRIAKFDGQIISTIPIKKGCASIEIEFENIHTCDAFLDKYGEYYFENGFSGMIYKWNMKNLTPCYYCSSDTVSPIEKDGNWSVHCSRCKVSSFGQCGIEKEAIARWNEEINFWRTHSITGVKGCPFCGDTAIFTVSNTGGDNMSHFVIGCSNASCGVQFGTYQPNCLGVFYDREAAIFEKLKNKWNRRIT